MSSPLPPGLPPALDVLGAPDPEPRRRGRRVLVALGAVAAVGVAGGAVALASYLGGGGAQPEDVLPAEALGMVKLDLDPAAGQKLAVYRLAKRFPSTQDRLGEEGDVKDSLLSALFAGEDEVDYARDVEPWIGDRVALAVVPGADEPQPLAALAFTDRGAAERALPRLLDGEDAAFAFSDNADYVLIGESQQSVDAAARGEDVLADAPSWQRGTAALDGDQVVTGWLDLGALAAALPAEARREAAEAYGIEELELGGTLVLGAHARDDHVEVVGRTLDVTSPFSLDSSIGSGEGSGLLAALPVNTVAALSVTNLGSGLAEVFERAYGEDDPLGIVATAAELGLDLPGDLRTLLGDDTVAAAFPEREMAVRTRTADAGAAYEVASELAAFAGGAVDPSQVLRRLEDGIAVGTGPAALDAVARADGGLGDVEAFRTAVPDAADAGVALYVDIPAALAMSGADLGEGARDLQQLRAFGASSSGDARSSTFRVRLTVRD